jgi:DNA-binding NarL/FixJ family response regulator
MLREQGARRIPRGPRPATRNNPLGLTRRESEVLALLAEGLTNAEIGQRLSITAKTADHHVAAILSKLGAHTRGEAVMIARRHLSLP